MPFLVPDDWISEADVIAATGVSSRKLTQWRAQGIVIGRRRYLGRGAGTTPCFYPPDTISLIKRLCELRRTVRDADWWIRQLWLVGFSVDPRKWAIRRLRGDIKLVEGAGRERVAEAAVRAAKAKLPGKFGPARNIFDRVRKPADRLAFFSWVAASFAGYEQQASIRTAEPPIFDIVKKAIGIPRSALAPTLESNLDRLPVRLFLQILVTADDHELEQARRDWQGIARLTEAMEATDWNLAGPELIPEIERLTESRPEPPSKRQRRAHRRRPYARPVYVDLFMKGLSDPQILPYLLALLIEIRRSSRENSTALTQAIAFAEVLISRLPRRAEDITPSEPIR
jgi:hypothetical protein